MANKIFWLRWKYLEKKQKKSDVLFFVLSVILITILIPFIKKEKLVALIPQLLTINTIFIGFLYSVLTTVRTTTVSEKMREKLVKGGISRFDVYIYAIGWTILVNFGSMLFALLLFIMDDNSFIIVLTLAVFLNSLYYTIKVVKEALYIYKN